MYLEDLYVKPDARGGGIGTELIRAIAQTAQDRNCARFQWQVIDWNDPAIGALSHTALSSDHRWGDPHPPSRKRRAHATYRALSVRIALDRADFYRERLGARERLETNDAKWLNYIMDREAIQKFLSS